MRFFCLINLLLISLNVLAQDLSKVYDKVNPAVVTLLSIEQNVIEFKGITQTVSDTSLGSGFMISNTDIITAAHVVNTAEEIEVQFFDGTTIKAEVITVHETADVALIRLNNPKYNITPIRLADSNNVKIGEQVFVIGAPFGYTHSLSVGHISSIRIPTTKSLNLFSQSEFIQTDAAINTGNSGAPLFNIQGEAIGVVSKILSKSGGFNGIGFAATSNMVKKLLIDKPTLWVGMEAFPLTGKIRRFFNVPQNSGLLVQKVVGGSWMDKMGLKGGDTLVEIEGQKLILGGDIILSINGIEFDMTDEVLTEIGKMATNLKPSSTISMKILREGKIVTLTR